MSMQTDLLEATTTMADSAPLRIDRVLAPDPHYGSGTYEVRLEMSRPMTCFEVQALHAARRGLLPVNRVLTVSDTTLERVAAEAECLGELVRQVEREGAKLQAQARRRAEEEALAEAEERARLAALAERIRFL
jgi:signal transduction histidine kinase